MPKKRPTRREYYGEQVAAPQRPPDQRLSAWKRGYDKRHQNWRQLILHRYPVCAMCKRNPATVADHIVPLRAGGGWEMENGQGLCRQCHNTKTHDDRQLYEVYSQPGRADYCNLSLPPGRIAIGGSCRTGKTTYAATIAAEHGVPLRHADDVIGQGPKMFWQWGGLVAPWFDEPGPWIIEGVRVVNALLHRMDAGQPANVDTVLWITKAVVPLTAYQVRFNRKLTAARNVVGQWLDTQGVNVMHWPRL